MLKLDPEFEYLRHASKAPHNNLLYDTYKGIRLYNIVVGCGINGLVVDHINNDRRDNRWANLQLISKSANQAKGLEKAQKGKYRGVVRKCDKWEAKVGLKGSRAVFETEFQAACGRDYLFRKTYPGVAFTKNVPEVTLTDEAFDMLRVKRTAYKLKDVSSSSTVKPSENNQKYYRVRFQGQFKIKEFVSRDYDYTKTWFYRLQDEGSETKFVDR
jgi:hypothetical protein